MAAWRPAVPGISEVLHASIADYAYPPHCHDTWTVLIVDDGAIRYDLDKRRRDASGARTVAVLPPGVIHDGRPAEGAPGFRKRNLYLQASFLPIALTGAAVDRTTVQDWRLRHALAELHNSLAAGEDPLDGEARLAMIRQRLGAHLDASRRESALTDTGAAHRLRALLDEHLVQPLTLEHASRLLDRSVPHLVRSFTRTFGVSPHAYVIGRRIDMARRLLLSGQAAAEVATAVGFYDQAHLTRHFRRHVSVTPARYAATNRRATTGP